MSKDQEYKEALALLVASNAVVRGEWDTQTALDFVKTCQMTPLTKVEKWAVHSEMEEARMATR